MNLAHVHASYLDYHGWSFFSHMQRVPVLIRDLSRSDVGPL